MKLPNYEKIYESVAGTILRVDNSTFAVYHYSMTKGAEVCTVVDYTVIKKCRKDFPISKKILGVANEYDLLIYRLQFTM